MKTKPVKSTDEIFDKFEIRKSNRKKTRFIEYTKSRLKKYGYTDEDIKVEERWKWIFKTRNIIVGDPKKARVIVSAHYDTCAVSPAPNFMFPLNYFLYFLSQIVLLAIGIFFAWWVMVPFALYVEPAEVSIYAFEVGLLLFAFQLQFGFTNIHAANDNTSGVITLFNILQKLPEEKRKDVCIVFFDNEEKGLLGSFFLKKNYPKLQNKLLLNVDCVGDGNNILFIAKKDALADKRYGFFTNAVENEIKKYDMKFISRKVRPLAFASDQVNFAKGVGICTLKKKFFGLYAGRIHTPFDTKCNAENIECISNSIVSGIKNLPNKKDKETDDNVEKQ